jgi:expansin (peptidoglycan-binding protein)
VKVQVNSGSNTWWFAVAVSGGSEDTVKAELFDSGVVPSFSIMVKASYGFYFSQSVQLTLPISLRLTSASGKQVVLEDFITSFTDSSVKDTKQDYSTSVTPAPTSKATTAPSTGTVKFQQHSDSSAWWFAVAVSGVDASKISKVELKDSNSVTSFSALASTDWGYYTFSTTGVALVAPVNVRVTTTDGQTATATFNDFTGSSVASASF